MLSPTVEDAVPGQRLVLTVHNMEPTVLRMVLRYMYSSEVDTVFRTTLPRYAAQLWMAAARFRIDELQQALRAYLLQHMTALHCVELLSTLALATDSDHPPPFHLCRQLEQRAVACFRRHAGKAIPLFRLRVLLDIQCASRARHECWAFSSSGHRFLM